MVQKAVSGAGDSSSRLAGFGIPNAVRDLYYKMTELCTREQALQYAKGQDVRLSPAQLAPLRDGYILMRYRASPLGCGLLQLGNVKNMLPKAKRLELRFI